MNGGELFQMSKSDMEKLLDKFEAKRLDEQLIVQKNITGVGRSSALPAQVEGSRIYVKIVSIK